MMSRHLAASTPPVIRCAVCNRPVDRLEVYRDECRCVYVYEAHCHGGIDTTVLTDRQLVEFGPAFQITGGLAFTSKRIGKDDV